jgi:hypothetical protein
VMRGTTIINLRRLIMARVRDGGSEGGVAMLTAILFMIIMAGVASMILGVVTAQVAPSYSAQKGTKTIYSAQAGIQAALAVIRTASKTQTINGLATTVGDVTKLPCTVSAPTNGTSDGNAYTVTISYYSTDPTAHAKDSTWLKSNSVGCVLPNPTSYGSATVPKFALLAAAGSATQIPVIATIGNRSITAVYQFKLSNANIPGGLITNTGATACLQVVTAAGGSQIGWAPIASCGQLSANAARQLWTYTPTWQLALASSQVGGAGGYCITGSVAPGKTTGTALLAACLTTSDANRWNQLWSWTGDYTWVGELPDISGPNTNPYLVATKPPAVVAAIGSYLSPGVADGTTPSATTFLQVTTSVVGTLAPTSLVGAGGAQHSTHQLVNYAEFGRCADVTNLVQPGTAGSLPFMISYPCKQDPTGGTSYITWNQKWFYCEETDIIPVPIPACAGKLPDGVAISASHQQLYVYYNDNTSQKYCFTAPTAPTTPPSPATQTPVYGPYFAACATSGPLVARQIWNRVYNTGDFTSSYLMINVSDGLCLGANSGELFKTSPAISDITLSQCNGQTYQQWNAIPTFTGGTVGGYREISGG